MKRISLIRSSALTKPRGSLIKDSIKEVQKLLDKAKGSVAKTDEDTSGENE